MLRPSWLPVPDLALQVWQRSGTWFVSRAVACWVGAVLRRAMLRRAKRCGVQNAVASNAAALLPNAQHCAAGAAFMLEVVEHKHMQRFLRLRMYASCPQTLLGEGAKVVLEGQRVLPSRTQQAGFSFKYSDVSDALKEVLR